MATIKDISLYCGVSASTVSKALHGYPDISEETSSRILEAAARLGYSPRPPQKCRHRSFHVGVICSGGTELLLENRQFLETYSALSRTFLSEGYDVTLLGSALPGDKNLSLSARYKLRELDGICVYGAISPDLDTMQLAEMEVPFVTVHTTIGRKASVLTDEEGGMAMLMDYLDRMGYRRPACISSQEFSGSQIVRAAFRKEAIRRRFFFSEHYLLEGSFYRTSSAEECTAALLSMPEPPDCIIYPDEAAAEKGMEAAVRKGFSVPGDLAVVSLTDGGSLLGQDRILTGLLSDHTKTGAMAARALLDQISRFETYIPSRLVLQNRLMEGTTLTARSVSG